METFELRYFLETSKTQNIHKASKLLGISPSAISKAITRLENELEVKLFEKVGRNIRITDSGKKLIKNASEMLALEKNIIESYNQSKESISIKIIGAELPLSFWISKVINKIQKQYEKSQFKIESVRNGLLGTQWLAMSQ